MKNFPDGNPNAHESHIQTNGIFWCEGCGGGGSTWLNHSRALSGAGG